MHEYKNNTCNRKVIQRQDFLSISRIHRQFGKRLQQSPVSSVEGKNVKQEKYPSLVITKCSCQLKDCDDSTGIEETTATETAYPPTQVDL